MKILYTKKKIFWTQGGPGPPLPSAWVRPCSHRSFFFPSLGYFFPPLDSSSIARATISLSIATFSLLVASFPFSFATLASFLNLLILAKTMVASSNPRLHVLLSNHLKYLQVDSSSYKQNPIRVYS